VSRTTGYRSYYYSYEVVAIPLVKIQPAMKELPEKELNEALRVLWLEKNLHAITAKHHLQVGDAVAVPRLGGFGVREITHIEGDKAYAVGDGTLDVMRYLSVTLYGSSGTRVSSIWSHTDTYSLKWLNKEPQASEVPLKYRRHENGVYVNILGVEDFMTEEYFTKFKKLLNGKWVDTTGGHEREPGPDH
jgi:hypothetical protein